MHLLQHRATAAGGEDTRHPPLGVGAAGAEDLRQDRRDPAPGGGVQPLGVAVDAVVVDRGAVGAAGDAQLAARAVDVLLDRQPRPRGEARHRVLCGGEPHVADQVDVEAAAAVGEGDAGAIVAHGDARAVEMAAEETGLAVAAEARGAEEAVAAVVGKREVAFDVSGIVVAEGQMTAPVHAGRRAGRRRRSGWGGRRRRRWQRLHRRQRAGGDGGAVGAGRRRSGGGSGRRRSGRRSGSGCSEPRRGGGRGRCRCGRRSGGGRGEPRRGGRCGRRRCGRRSGSGCGKPRRGGERRQRRRGRRGRWSGWAWRRGRLRGQDRERQCQGQCAGERPAAGAAVETAAPMRREQRGDAPGQLCAARHRHGGHRRLAMAP